MKFELYSRRGFWARKQWYWRLKASNGRVIAVSGEGYNNRIDAVNGIELVRGQREIAIEETGK